jgi:hypothetical protein
MRARFRVFVTGTGFEGVAAGFSRPAGVRLKAAVAGLETGCKLVP